MIRRLASGGTSDVLLARPIKPAGDHRPVVLKMLLPSYRDDPQFERLLARDAEAYGRLHHPFIVQLFEVFAVRDKLVIVLEYVDGLALNRLRSQLQGAGGWLDDRASAYLAWCVFSALSAAHTSRDPETGILAPVIHRDINPSNVLIPWDGRVKLGDFSIGKVTNVSGDAGKTSAGITKGTFGYMAPEQVRGEKVTEKTDIYTATLLLWEQFARRKAIQYAALPEIEVMRAMAYPHLVSLDVLRPDLPEAIRRAVAVGLEADPAKRELSAESMMEILRDFVAPDEGRRLLQDTLYRLREREDEPAGRDSSWAKMTPITMDAVPDASYNGGASARGEESLPAFSIETSDPGAPALAAPVVTAVDRISTDDEDRETLPTSSVAVGAGIPRSAIDEFVEDSGYHAAPADMEVTDATAATYGDGPDAEPPTLAREYESRPPSAVSFSELLLPRSAEPMPGRVDAELTNTPSSIPPGHQETLMGGLHGVAPHEPFTTEVDEREVAPPPAPPSAPAPVEETLVSPAPTGFAPPKSVNVSVSDAPPPVRPEGGTSSPDLSRTIPTDSPPVVTTGGPSHALAATVPAIPSTILAQQNPPVIAPAESGRMFEGGKGAKSRVLWWLVGGVALFGVGLGAASLFVKHGEPPGAQTSVSEPAKVQEPPVAATPPPTPAPEPKAAEPKVEPKPAEPKPEPKAEAKPEPKPEAKPVEAPAAGGNTGTLVVERGGGHRIYFDGKVVAQGAGSHVVPCGRHTVKVGSDGKAQELTVPCGGSVTAQ
ncbi:protein kinase [Pendulispora brunnea]|uniref:Protein kinase n=1 Tax=Pendulispora brunnea TaxID=2905690 RepID=A0ABZ2KLT2_9BACT